MYSKYFRLNFLHLSYCSLNRWIRLEISFSSFLSANYACKLLKNNFIAVMCTAKYNLPCRSFASTVSFQKDFFSTKKLIINSLQTRRTHTGLVGNSFLVFVASINVRVLNQWLTFFAAAVWAPFRNHAPSQVCVRFCNEWQNTTFATSSQFNCKFFEV